MAATPGKGSLQALRDFTLGIARHFYLYVFQGALQGQDWYNAHRPVGWPELTVPSDWLWPAFTIGLLIAAFLSYRELYRSVPEAARAAVEEVTIARKERDELRTQLARKHRNQKFADDLTKLVNQGVHELLNAKIDTPEEFTAARDLDALWIATILNRMREQGCSAQEMSSVEVLQDLSGEPTFHPVSDRNLFKRIVNLRLKRIRRIVDLYAETPVMALDRDDRGVARYG